MIMISSKGGQRMARAGARLEGLDLVPEIDARQEKELSDEYDEACREVLAELIAMNHHTGEGD